MANGLRLSLKRVNLNASNLVAPGQPVYQAVERAAKEAVKLAKQEAPKRSGNLADSISYRLRQAPTRVYAEIGPVDKVYGVGTPPVEYVRYVTFGTRGPIVPKAPNRYLKIRPGGGGGAIFRTSVAGQQANDFLVRAVKQVRKASFEQG